MKKRPWPKKRPAAKVDPGPPKPAECWCGLPAEYSIELVNARVGTGRFARCKAHAIRDVATGDFKLQERMIR